MSVPGAPGPLPADPGPPGTGPAPGGPRPPRGWRRLLPDSLFGRLMGVLALGLMLAQLLSAAINVAERDALLNRGYGLGAAQRIADVVALLDGLPAAERDKVVAVFQVPPLVLSLHDAPVLPADPPADPAGLLFRARLRAALEGERPFRVAPRPPGEGRPRPEFREPWGPGAMAGMRRGMAAPAEAPQPGRAAGRDTGRGDGRGDDRGDEHDARPEADQALGRDADRDAERQRRRAARQAEEGGRPRGAGGPIWRTEVALRDGRWARFDAVLPARAARLPWTLAAQLGVLLASMLVLAWLAVHGVTRPLKTLADAAQALGRDIGRPPLDESGPREVRQAAQAFNTMQRQLAQGIQERTRMLTALSHDLKTPLTRMRLRAELLDDDEARQRFERDLHEMEAMVAETLAFLRGLGAPDGQPPRMPVDIAALAAALQADQAALGRTVRLQGQALAPLPAVPSLLKRALGNLLDNAALYGGGQPVDLLIEDGPQALALSVLDSGPGIPAAELERVFEPFYRLEASRSRATGGTGLGLGIARSIAQLHGGTLTLRNRPEGGLQARLLLPRGAAAAAAPGAAGG